MKENEKPNDILAFPCLDNNEHSGQLKIYSEGMTLRDYFAAKAMQSIINANIINVGKEFLIGKTGKPNETIAMDSYGIADEMLKERTK